MVYNNNNNNKNNNISYEIVDFPNNSKSFGSYTGNSPKKAASKAFTFLSNIMGNKINSESGKFIVFVIRNIDTKKEYKYIGTVVKLENPVTKYIDGQEVIYKYKNVIGRYNKELDKLNNLN